MINLNINVNINLNIKHEILYLEIETLCGIKFYKKDKLEIP